MCLAIPALIVELKSDSAVVSTDALQSIVGRSLVPEARTGDWVLVNAGQIVSLITPGEAQAVRELLREMMMHGAEESVSRR